VNDYRGKTKSLGVADLKHELMMLSFSAISYQLFKSVIEIFSFQVHISIQQRQSL
jgi:hypothetical protein